MRPLTLSLLPLALAACAPTDDTGDKPDTGGDTDTSTDTADTSTDTGETGDTAVDDDGDGHSPPEDCNDADGAVHPDATEVCNGTDDDCDGETDEGTGGTWYEDADADGHGGAEVWACTQPAGSVEVADDCDDADGTVYPGAPEVCGDERVNDCDGDEAGARGACPVEWPAGAADLDGLWTVGVSSGGGGTSVAMGDVDGDGLDDVLVGAPWTTPGDELGYAGRAYLVLATAGTTGTLESAASATIDGATQYANLGQSVALAPDLDGDGLVDVLVGAPSSSQEGAGFYVFLGGLAAEEDSGTADASFVRSGGAGTALAGAGDLDGDGLNDILAGDPLVQNEGYVGQVDLFRGAPAGALSASGWIRGTAGAGGRLGTSVGSAGDFDGDGLADVVAGAPTQWVDEAQRGSAYVVLGAATLPEVEVQHVAVMTLSGETANAELGNAVAGVGDMDGDGLDDVAVGERYGGTYRNGRVYIVFGGTTGSAVASAAPVTIAGSADWALAGSAVAAAGDADADGLADVLVGAPGDWNESATPGTAWLVLGGLSGTLDLASVGTGTEGTTAQDGFGAALASGDHDGDGRPDALIGAPGYDLYGAAYLLHGPTTW